MGTDERLLDALRKKIAAGDPALAYDPPEILPPSSAEELAAAEAALGVELDPLVRRVYRELSGGGWGPGRGAWPLLGPDSVVSRYPYGRDDDFEDGSVWPVGVVPIWDWGCAIYSCVDAAGRVVTYDSVDGLTLTRFDVATWLKTWCDGVRLWDEMYIDKPVTVMNPFTKEPIITKVRDKIIGTPWTPPKPKR
jgi:hypothetical protein